jgi:hypothetical protein
VAAALKGDKTLAELAQQVDAYVAEHLLGLPRSF